MENPRALAVLFPLLALSCSNMDIPTIPESKPAEHVSEKNASAIAIPRSDAQAQATQPTPTRAIDSSPNFDKKNNDATIEMYRLVEAGLRWATADGRGQCPMDIHDLDRYMKKDTNAKDPWGQDYVLCCKIDTKYDYARVVIWFSSAGKDGQPGTSDDVEVGSLGNSEGTFQDGMCPSPRMIEGQFRAIEGE